MLQKERTTSLNVKDPEAHRLARAIAEVTGETLTHAVLFKQPLRIRDVICSTKCDVRNRVIAV